LCPCKTINVRSGNGREKFDVEEWGQHLRSNKVSIFLQGIEFSPLIIEEKKEVRYTAGIGWCGSPHLVAEPLFYLGAQVFGPATPQETPPWDGPIIIRSELFGQCRVILAARQIDDGLGEVALAEADAAALAIPD